MNINKTTENKAAKKKLPNRSSVFLHTPKNKPVTTNRKPSPMPTHPRVILLNPRIRIPIQAPPMATNKFCLSNKNRFNIPSIVYINKTLKETFLVLISINELILNRLPTHSIVNKIYYPPHL